MDGGDGGDMERMGGDVTGSGTPSLVSGSTKAIIALLGFLSVFFLLPDLVPDVL